MESLTDSSLRILGLFIIVPITLFVILDFGVFLLLFSLFWLFGLGLLCCAKIAHWAPLPPLDTAELHLLIRHFEDR
ncbi:MAG: hypothetical protein P8Y64_00570 [Gammaproteobacteria bacterium]